MGNKRDYSDGHYEIGKGKPPRHTRFKPGQSGNPKGRPKGRKNMATLLQNVLDRKVVMNQNGRPRKVPFSEAFVELFAQKAIHGTTKEMMAAMKAIHDYVPEAFQESNLPQKIVVEFVESDGNGGLKEKPMTKSADPEPRRADDDASDEAWRASGLADEDDDPVPNP